VNCELKIFQRKIDSFEKNYILINSNVTIGKVFKKRIKSVFEKIFFFIRRANNFVLRKNKNSFSFIRCI
jgi:hypothetical protein